jgi:NADPH2:quinone reductase
MKAAVTTRAGGPEVIVIEENWPKPVPKGDEVLIRVKAFGLNRAELFTRQGESPGVQFPVIQGIECVGIVEQDLSGTYQKGQQVAAIMGGMGRYINGGYAEYVAVPVSITIPFQSNLPWHILGAIPEMFQTVSGSLIQALEIAPGETILIRGGTSSIGILSAQLAKVYGLTVISTTRNPDKTDHLKANGADYVLIDDGDVSSELRELMPQGVKKVLELIGTPTLKDSLKCISSKGIVCMTGILGGEWVLKEFQPMGDIPSLGRLTVYMGESEDLDESRLQEFLDAVEKGSITIVTDKIFTLEQIADAHAYMESNQSKGKLVIEL